jgi:AcrR family transcriptional regulator
MVREQTRRTAEGTATSERLLRRAEEVFSRSGYHSASVSAICREAGLAHGTFYRYFDNKEDIFLRIVERLETRFTARLAAAGQGASTTAERLLACYGTLLACVEEDAAVYNVFREAEFIRPEVARRFYTAVAEVVRSVVEEGVRKGDLHSANSEVVAHAILGMALFTALRYVIWDPGSLTPSIRRVGQKVILQGIDAHGEAAADMFDTSLAAPGRPELQSAGPSPEGGEATRQALLAAAERLFGEAGFYATTIAEITYIAGVALGTFYLYFPSKVAIFDEVTRLVSRRLRHEEKATLEGLVDRRAIECVGYRIFFRWIRRHVGAYRILREAEFVDQGRVGREHYQQLAHAYAVGLAGGMKRGEIRKHDPEALTYALLGIAHFGGQRWVLWDNPESLAEAALPPLWEFILHGVGCRSSGAMSTVQTQSTKRQKPTR